MQAPPFQPSPLIAAFVPAAHRAAAAAPERARRARLAELDPHLHCSLLGTCLGTAELRRLVPRFTALDRDHASDLDLHHAAVELAVEGGAGAKALHKLLDDHHAAALRRFNAAEGEAALAVLWSDALASGEVPGAYWALMTHPQATPALRQRAFGDVHMLSHLVGASNRADLRRLLALERDNAELKAQAERQQNRLRELAVERHETVGHMSRQVIDLTGRLKREAAPGTAALLGELALLRHGVHQREQQLALHTSRREQAEQSSAAALADVQRLEAELARAVALAESLHGEVRALEQQLQAGLQADAGANTMAGWAGRRVLYVGGRPSSNQMIRSLCERAGVALQLHDGGIEDRKGQLPAAVPGSDLVLLPVDCVDHDSMNRLKKLCARHDVPFKPLRTASLACVVAALSEPRAGSHRPGPCCPGHG